jgi:hypothetical protein
MRVNRLDLIGVTGVIIMSIGRFVRMNMKVRAMVSRMAVPHRDPAPGPGFGIEQQQFGRAQRAKYRRPSNHHFARDPHI